MNGKLKKSGEELQMYLYFKKKHHMTKLKKGKGSYNRKDFKKILNED